METELKQPFDKLGVTESEIRYTVVVVTGAVTVDKLVMAVDRRKYDRSES